MPSQRGWRVSPSAAAPLLCCMAGRLVPHCGLQGELHQMGNKSVFAWPGGWSCTVDCRASCGG